MNWNYLLIGLNKFKLQLQLTLRVTEKLYWTLPVCVNGEVVEMGRSWSQSGRLPCETPVQFFPRELTTQRLNKCTHRQIIELDISWRRRNTILIQQWRTTTKQ